MARVVRADLVDPAEVAVFHCVNRCVRRCFLCGSDPVTGKDYEHRKTWLEARLKFLAGAFGIDVLGFAILSNHFHLILRSRPDVVARWSDAEVAIRWLQLCPLRKSDDGQPAEPTDRERDAICNDAQRVLKLRRRLSDISWLMRMATEPVARRANREDEATGRFWQGRFRAVKLCDEAAVLACAAYVDLNPIRAGIAATLEGSDHTSVQCRIAASNQPPDSASHRDDWLAPLTLDERAAASVSVRPSCSGLRASDLGFLPMSLSDYLELLDWTCQQARRNEQDPNEHCRAKDISQPPILVRLGIASAAWLCLAMQFGRLFQRVAGAPQSVARLPQRHRFRCRRALLLGSA